MKGRLNNPGFSRIIPGVILIFFCQLTTAHHSPVAFDTEVTDFSINGVISKVDIRNPHSMITLLVTSEDGSETEWDVEFSSINLLLRRGWDFDRLQVGDQVICTGNPSARGKQEMYMWSILLADGTEFGR